MEKEWLLGIYREFGRRDQVRSILKQRNYDTDLELFSLDEALEYNGTQKSVKNMMVIGLWILIGR